MKRILFAVLCAALLCAVPQQAQAQDHSHHGHTTTAAQVFKTDSAKPPTCAEGECPMMKEGKSCCCKNGTCPMKEGKACGCCKDGKCPMMGGHEQHGGMSMPEATGDPALDELNAAMAKMHADMAVAHTGDPDADFIRGMIPHHQGAIDMATIVLKHGDDPETRALAKTIIRAQKGEIALMKRWLAKRQIPQKDAIDLRK